MVVLIIVGNFNFFVKLGCWGMNILIGRVNILIMRLFVNLGINFGIKD